MIRVVSSTVDSAHLNRLDEWFIAEWGKEGALRLADSTEPRPLVALEHDEALGGLAFSRFRRPGGESLALWINALFVVPDHRRKGIASQLIRAAEAEADQLGEKELYALTDIPILYVNLGWRCIDSDSAGTVVGKIAATVSP